MLHGMQQGEQGPMNAVWFYDTSNPFYPANKWHQDRNWKEAASAYKKLLEAGYGDGYDRGMAEVNLAGCIWAEKREATEYWSSFDTVLGIPEHQRISPKIVKNAMVKKEDKKSILVRTDKDGIGDIFHFLKTAHELKKCTGWEVTVSVRPLLKETLSGAVDAYGLKLIGEKDEQPVTDYATHIISLLGHLKMNPADTAPEKVMFTAPERATLAVMQQMDPDSIAIIPAASEIIRNGDAHFPFRQNSNFYYLTGFDEPDAVMVLAPKRKEGEFILFNRVRDREHEIWDGPRAGQAGAKSEYRADQAFAFHEFESKLPSFIADRKVIYYPIGYQKKFDQSILSALQYNRTYVRSGLQTPATF
ncbi:MAG: aminopeptidase P N-terminal domain-containing protein, partial [Candidatus Paceibacterales bacterium]